MSSSDPPRGRLEVRARGARIDVLDARLRPVPGSGTLGELTVDVPAGAYEVRGRIGAAEATTTVLVRPGAARQVELRVPFDAPAPVAGAVTSNETHAVLAADVTAAAPGDAAPDVPLVVLLRGLRHRDAALLPATPPFQVLDAAGRLLPVPDQPARDRDRHRPARALAWRLLLPPGGYTLRWPGRPASPVEHAVWLPPGWQTVLFVPQGPFGPYPPGMSVHLLPLGHRWDGWSPEAGAVETSLAALRTGGPVRVDQVDGRLSDGRVDPMLLLLQLHLRARSRGGGPDPGDAGVDAPTTAGIRLLEEVVGPHPDVLALAVGAGPGPAPVQSPWPPLLAASLDLLLDAAAEDPEVIPAGSTTELVTGQRRAGGPWLMWEPLPRDRAAVAPPGALGDVTVGAPRPGRPPAPAVGRVAALLRDVGAVLGVGAADVAVDLGEEEIAQRLGMTRALVRRALPGALARFPPAVPRAAAADVPRPARAETTGWCTVHYDNGAGLPDPHLWVWYDDSPAREDLAPVGADDHGPVYRFTPARPRFGLTFKSGPGTRGPWEGRDRVHQPAPGSAGQGTPELWCSADGAFVHDVHPAPPEPVSAESFLTELFTRSGPPPGVHVPDAGGLSGLGATVLTDGRVLFGLYHPTAARVHLVGEFNDWQHPGHPSPDPGRFLPMHRYRGWSGRPATWLLVCDRAHPGDEYRFFVEGGVPTDPTGRRQRLVDDPFARQLAADLRDGDPVVVDPSTHPWSDQGWRIPDPADLVLYELSVHGFTDDDPDIPPEHRGRFAGITDRIRQGYFRELGITALSLMPLAEVPSVQGPNALGYDPSSYCAVERDFGTPDDLRTLVDTAHGAGLAVLVDMVFNHTSNDVNPLWRAVLLDPADDDRPDVGGLYFSGRTPWGNRVATERFEVQNLLVDTCRLFLREYHVDGFRLDATHTDYMDHGFVLRLANELRAVRPDVLIVAENLPNQADLDLEGWNGLAQWSDVFHDTLKARLREEGGGHLGDAFYFSRSSFAAHTNNTVNYTESHDEDSVAHWVGYNPWLRDESARDRKGRLGLFATLVALGQPMLYMGQEFNVDRPRNTVTVHWPADLSQHGFFQWASRLVRLRGRHPGLRLHGPDPAGAGQFRWVLGPWLDDRHGGGRSVIGWQAHPGPGAERLVVLLNFEGVEVTVDLELGPPGRWVRLADLDRVDVPPDDQTPGQALHSDDGRFAGFTLPSSSGFVYAWAGHR